MKLAGNKRVTKQVSPDTKNVSSEDNFRPARSLDLSLRDREERHELKENLVDTKIATMKSSLVNTRRTCIKIPSTFELDGAAFAVSDDF